MRPSGNDENRRIAAEHLSLFRFLCNRAGYKLLTAEEWSTQFVVRQSTLSVIRQILKGAYTQGRGKREGLAELKTLKQLIASEFTGDFPVAKVIFFKIYRLCVEVLNTLAQSKSAHSHWGNVTLSQINRIT